MNIIRFITIFTLIAFSLDIFADDKVVNLSQIDEIKQKKEEQKKMMEFSYLQWDGKTVIPKMETVEKYNPRKPLWISFLGTFGLNLTLWSYNRFIDQAGHSMISLASMEKNLKHGFDYDADSLDINFWGHPFQGAMYYNTARSLGHDYLTSMSVTAFGSLQWEFFMEIEPAAINDFIITTMAGSMFGEMFYRLSSLIIDESTEGSERIAREIGAGSFNPGRLLNRLIFRRVARDSKDPIYHKEPYSFNVAFGMNTISDGVNIDVNGKKRNMIFDFMFIYGYPFGKKTYKPFDHFTLDMMLNLTMNKQPLMGSFLIDSIFYGKQFNLGKHKIILSINQSFEYLENNVYQIAALDLGGMFMYRSPKLKFMGILFKTGAYFIPMGGVNSDYAQYYLVDELNRSRDYNVSFGVNLKSSLIVVLPYTLFKIDYLFWWFKTYQGARGNEIIGVLKPTLSFRIFGRIKLGFQYFIYHRRGKYNEFPDINSSNYEKRMFISFDF